VHIRVVNAAVDAGVLATAMVAASSAPAFRFQPGISAFARRRRPTRRPRRRP